jgi:hypothetical protein
MLGAGALAALGPSGPAGALGTSSVVSTVAFTPGGYGVSTSALLPDGKLLVADALENQVVEMNPDGSGQSVFASGLSNPRGIAVDPVHGYVYVADAGEYGVDGSAALIRFGLDGSGKATFTTDGTNELGIPVHVAVDAAGDVLVLTNSDYNVGEISELQFDFTTGALESISLIGPSTDMANLSEPSSIAISPAGDIYIAEYAGLFVLPAGSSTWVQTNYPTSTPTPTALAFSDGALLVSADNVLDGDVPEPQLLSYPVDGSGATQTLGTPTVLDDVAPDGITVAPSGISGVSEGTLFLTDGIPVDEGGHSTYYGAVQEASADGSNLTTIALGGDDEPHYGIVAYDAYSQKLLVGDQTLGTITEMEPDGSDQRVLITGYGASTTTIAAIAANPTTGAIYVAGSGNSLVTYPTVGGSLATATAVGTTPLGATSLFATPSRLYIGSEFGVYTWPWSGTIFTTLQGAPLDTRAIAVDSHGTVFDAYGAGTSTGLESFPSTPNANATQLAAFGDSPPSSITLDASGRLFVSSTFGAITEISTQGLDARSLTVGGISRSLAATPSGQLFDAYGDTLLSISIPPVATITASSPGSVLRGAGGTLTVRGSDLLGSTTVFLYDGSHTLALAAKDVSSSSLVATIPTMPAGTYEVEVAGPGGVTLPAAAATLTVRSNAPVIKGLSPSMGTDKGHQVVAINGTFLAAATAVHFGGVVITPKHFLSDALTRLKVDAPAHKPGKVTVFVVTKAGRSASSSFTYT